MRSLKKMLPQKNVRILIVSFCEKDLVCAGLSLKVKLEVKTLKKFRILRHVV